MSWQNDKLIGTQKDDDKEGSRSTFEYIGGVMSQMPRQAGLTARNVLTGLTGIPALAADVTMSGINLALPENMRQRMPSEALQGLLSDVGLPEAETGLERTLGMIQAGLAGSRIDPLAATAAARATGARGTGGPSLSTPAQDTFVEGRGQGYVLPPATIRNDMPTQIIESVGGKRITAEAASQKNQDVTNRLAARALGLSENQPLTIGTLKAVRNEAGQTYQQIRDSGQILADRQYASDLQRINSEIQKISSDFPDLEIGARKEIEQLVKGMDQKQFSADSAVSLLRKLRSDATKNIKVKDDPVKNDLGLAQRDAASALENAILRHLRNIGKDDVADEFSKARARIAKSHDIESATDFGSGNVDAAKFARLLSRGEPLSGELELIGRMGASFPQATRAPRGSAGVSAADIWSGGSVAGLGALTSTPEAVAAGIALPFLRRGVVRGILSEPVQNVLTREYPGIPGRTAGASAGLLGTESEEEQRRRRERQR